MKKLYLHHFATPLGPFSVASTDEGLALISFSPHQSHFETEIKKRFAGFELIAGPDENAKVEKEIKSYLEGRLKEFTVKLDLRGTPFQVTVLKKIAQIPYGTTATYGEIARSLGKPGASRAVGMVNARNPLAPVIPCHRVVAAHGLGGYAGGPEMKKFLLNLEGIQFKD